MERAEVHEAPRLGESVAELLTMVQCARREETRTLDGVRCLALVHPGHGLAGLDVNHFRSEAEVGYHDAALRGFRFLAGPARQARRAQAERAEPDGEQAPRVSRRSPSHCRPNQP